MDGLNWEEEVCIPCVLGIRVSGQSLISNG